MARSEAEIAARVVKWLEGYEVYQEVQVGCGGPRADIVAVCGPKLWVIEVKTRFSLALMEQAMGWSNMAHLVSVAVGTTNGHKGATIKHTVAKMLGVGWIEVGTSDYSEDVNEATRPKWNKARASKFLRRHLHEEQKTGLAAGSKAGGYWSPFRATCKELLKYTKANPGATLRDAIGSIQHHYASTPSACGALATWIDEGKVDGIELRREGRRIRVYPKEE